jgi:hypothetical protein
VNLAWFVGTVVTVAIRFTASSRSPLLVTPIREYKQNEQVSSNVSRRARMYSRFHASVCLSNKCISTLATFACILQDLSRSTAKAGKQNSMCGI